MCCAVKCPTFLCLLLILLSCSCSSDMCPLYSIHHTYHDVPFSCITTLAGYYATHPSISISLCLSYSHVSGVFVRTLKDSRPTSCEGVAERISGMSRYGINSCCPMPTRCVIIPSNTHVRPRRIRRGKLEVRLFFASVARIMLISLFTEIGTLSPVAPSPCPSSGGERSLVICQCCHGPEDKLRRFAELSRRAHCVWCVSITATGGSSRRWACGSLRFGLRISIWRHWSRSVRLLPNFASSRLVGRPLD